MERGTMLILGVVAGFFLLLLVMFMLTKERYSPERRKKPMKKVRRSFSVRRKSPRAVRRKQ